MSATKLAQLHAALTIIATALAIFALTYTFADIRPFVIASATFLTAYAVLSAAFPGSNGIECKAFTLAFSFGWAATGVSSLFLHELNDWHQQSRDAGHFYRLATAQNLNLNLPGIARLTEGSLAVLCWNKAYALSRELGLGNERYIACALNTVMVSLASVVSVRIAVIANLSTTQQLRLSLACGCCGLFWAFQGLLLRDGYILLAVSLLSYSWCKFLSNPPSFSGAIILALANSVASIVLKYLRDEFAFVPFAMALAAGTAVLLTHHTRNRSGAATSIYISLALLLLASAVATVAGVSPSSAKDKLKRGNESYGEHALQTAKKDSLGAALIVAQPLPLRITLGSVYLLVFPVPAWSGLLMGSAYHLFKSANVILFYIVIPFAIASLYQSFGPLRERNTTLLFCVATFTLFLTATAATSLETRHIAPFFPLLFVYASSAYIEQQQVRRVYDAARRAFLCGVLTVHSLYALLRL